MSHLKSLNDRSRGKQSTSFPKAEPSETLRRKGNIISSQISSINLLLSPPGGSFISNTFEGGLNRDGSLFYLAKTLLVLHKELRED